MEILAAIIGAMITIIPLFLIFRRQKENLNKSTEKIHFELFIHYTQKYNSLNNLLKKIDYSKISNENTDIPMDIEIVVLDYIDLCAEEYYWYKENLIKKDVWEFWQNGIMQEFKNNFIKSLLRKIFEGINNNSIIDSYYGFIQSGLVKKILS